MFKVKIVTIGKHKEKWLILALKEYEKRLQHEIEFEWIIKKDEFQLEKLVEKIESYICLDCQGDLLSSYEFSKKYFYLLEKLNSNLTIFIGGDRGFSKKILKKAKYLLSLSPLTFTHQMTRLILLEQIYRAHQIRKNSNYHK